MQFTSEEGYHNNALWQKSHVFLEILKPNSRITIFQLQQDAAAIVSAKSISIEGEQAIIKEKESIIDEKVSRIDQQNKQIDSLVEENKSLLQASDEARKVHMSFYRCFSRS